MTVMSPHAPSVLEDVQMLAPPLVDGRIPMEVSALPGLNDVSEVTSTADSQNACVLRPSTKFRWTIENFRKLKEPKILSDGFDCGGLKWHILIFPNGNDYPNSFSVYLTISDSYKMPYGWQMNVQFALTIVNQLAAKYTDRKELNKWFNARYTDWGLMAFMPLSELYDEGKGYIVNDTCIIEAEVIINCTLNENVVYDSKKEAGYVGLKNQGATCYMNSLLQTLYHIPYFRKAVYHMPTTDNDMPSGSIPLALQSLFYKLQYNDRSVGTKGLTKSFGWDTRDSFMQHDVEEFNRVLCERLEGKMKGTRVEGTIQHLFEGYIKNYIECLDVDYESTRKESFYDLQLDVKGCRDVYASFDKYIEVEKLDGDNKYHAEQHGLQNAEKGILFLDFPPVLQLHLKRFEYDFIRNSNAKINDRYEFPLQLDLDIDGGKYLSPEADRRVRNLYTLHSVLVHSGGVHGGHYYAFIRPTLSDKWFRFDDERVTREGLKMALEEQYGGEQELPQTNPGSNNTTLKFTKSSNAYMLVYIRESDKENIICDVDEKDIAQHLRVRLNKEQEEKEHKKKEKADAHLYTTIKVTRDCDLAQQIGRDIFFDLVDQERVHNFCALKDTPFRLFKEEVAKEFDVPVHFMRFWLWAKRTNCTYRLHRLLSRKEESLSVGEMQDRLFREQFTEMKFFVEVEVGQDSYPILPSEKTEDDFLLFFKFYNPEKEELRYVGKLIVKNIGKPIEILEKLNEMAGLPENEEIDLYEEVRFEPDVMCTPLDKEDTFHSHQLEDGDIICYQKSSSLMSDEQIRYLDVPSFLKYIRNRQVVCFRSMEKPKDEDFYLELSKKFTYEDIVDSVAAQLGLDDPSKIRLTPHNSRLDMPKNQPIKYRSVDTLLAMLVTNGQISDILYYEVLDIPLPELQCCQSLKIVYHHAIHDEAIVHAIRLPQSSTVVDIINNLKTKIHIYHPNAEFRLVEIFYHKIYKIFSPSEKIENINDQNWTLRFEEIPEEEKYMGPNDRLVHIYHFRKKPNQMMTIENFGNPFLFAMRSDETLSEIKIRIQKRLHISDEEFSKWRFAFCALGRAEYLEDDDIVLSRFQNRDVYGPWEQYLGLEHSNTAAPMKIHNAQQNENILQPYVKPVKIQ